MGEQQPQSKLYVVGVGASAGGLDALERFFDAMPPGGGMAFVVVQHLSPDFKSLMKELLGRHTTMAVHRVEDDMALEADSIYLIPPQKNLVVKGGRLRLREQSDGQRAPNFAIDVFFESLANAFGARSVAVVLSGTGSDGSRGIRNVHEAGGLVLVQDPDSAQFDGMPRSAIATGAVHSVLPPAEISRSVYKYVTQVDDTDRDGGALSLADQSMIAEVVALLRSDDGVDFSHYRRATLARRLHRRMSLGGHPSMSDYVRVLAANRAERQALKNDLLIGVTAFFRDQPAWDSLRKDVLEPMVRDREPDNPIRIWVSACATGEEVYTMGMVLLEVMRRLEKPIDLKIFATDIDQRSLETAALGVYSANLVDALPREYQSWYFMPEGRGFRVSQRLRQLVIFAEHNLARDAPFTNMDLVTCRNTLIYMEPVLQRRVLGSLHFALKRGGSLLLGAAESLGELESEFEATDTKWKIFKKRRDVRLTDPALSGFGQPQMLTRRLAQPRLFASRESSFGRSGDVLESAFRMMLYERHSAAFVVDRQHEILYSFGKTSLFMQVPEGAGTRDIKKLVIQPVMLALGSALQSAQESREPVSFTGLESGDDEFRVNLSVRSRRSDADTDEFSVVLLERVSKDGTSNPRPEQPFTVEEHVANRVRALEVELQQSKEGLQATIEELEATNEEHQATNEELLAANEQLQSTNEELQSVNEELHTVNAEHQSKIQELTDLNNDLDNMMRRSEIGTLFLDSRARVRKYTPFVLEIVRLNEKDIGRSIDTFNHTTSVPDLWVKLREVGITGKTFECRTSTRSGKEIYVRCLPYEIGVDEYAGVMATFIDMSLVGRMQNVELHDADRGGEQAESSAGA